MDVDGRRDAVGRSADLIGAAGVGLLAIDRHGVITSANRAATDVLLRDEPDLVGTRAVDTLTVAGPLADGLARLSRNGETVHRDDDTFHRADGSIVPVWWTMTPLPEAVPGTTGTATGGAVLVFGDNTWRRARAVADAAEHTRSRADLSAARRSISDLQWVSEISHALSSTLDETEVLIRLARLLVSRIADIAMTVRIDQSGTARFVASATSSALVVDGVDLDDAVRDERLITELGDYLVGPRGTTPVVAGAASTPDDLDRLRAAAAAVGADAVMVIPLVARNHALGAFVALRLAGEPEFAPVDRIAGQDIAHRAALALDNARLYRSQSDVARRLQQALLPALPRHVPVRAAVHYRPARNRFDVGGDWYDVFRCPVDSRTTVLVIGDVAGHDVVAGTTMSALRNLLRGVTVVTDMDAAEVLTAVDSNLDALGVAGTATTVMMTVSPSDDDTWTVDWSNAGHMPPLVLLPDRSVEMLDELHGPLLGTRMGLPRTKSSRSLPSGSTLVLYTDGLVETRDRSIELGLTRLRQTARALESALDDPEAICLELVEGNQASTEDDTAMLVCHLPSLRR